MLEFVHANKGSKSAHTYTLSVNQILQNTFAILNYEKQRNLETIGSSVMSASEIYRQVKTYKRRIGKFTGAQYDCLAQTVRRHIYLTIRPKIYMVKVDIATCFDSIKQDKLLDILQKILVEVRFCYKQKDVV